MTAMIVASRKPKHRRTHSHTEIHISPRGELIYPHMRVRVLAEKAATDSKVEVSA